MADSGENKNGVEKRTDGMDGWNEELADDLIRAA